jgi:predicted dehydrogenase
VTAPSPIRFGLVGTGYWARITHARALAAVAASADVEFAAVWGRDPQAASALAAEHGTRGHDDFGAFLADIDAVAFAVPPDVQADLAIRAANAGKHLLLEKPIATHESAADELARAVREAGVASVVFFTGRFQADMRAWLGEVRENGHWAGGTAIWLGSSMLESSPFNTPWRRAKGGLWDLGPHLVSLLWASLGPMRVIAADTGPRDVTSLVLRHDSGATSTVTVTQAATEQASGFELTLWGDAGRWRAPDATDQPQVALQVALGELTANARAGLTRHDCDVQFGRAVTAVLAQAQRLSSTG